MLIEAIVSKVIKEKFETQTFNDENGVFRVIDIFNWAKKNAPLVSFNIDKLAEIAFKPSPFEAEEDIPGSDSFVKRAMESDLKYPIIVVRYDDGDFIADGVHRLWKARSEGLTEIKGYLMQEKDLLQLK